MIRGLMLLFEGRKPLNLATRKKAGEISGKIIKDGKPSVFFRMDSNDDIVIVIRDKDVIVVYE